MIYHLSAHSNELGIPDCSPLSGHHFTLRIVQEPDDMGNPVSESMTFNVEPNRRRRKGEPKAIRLDEAEVAERDFFLTIWVVIDTALKGAGDPTSELLVAVEALRPRKVRRR
jgi:hypothetical protein